MKPIFKGMLLMFTNITLIACINNNTDRSTAKTNKAEFDSLSIRKQYQEKGGARDIQINRKTDWQKFMGSKGYSLTQKIDSFFFVLDNNLVSYKVVDSIPDITNIKVIHEYFSNNDVIDYFENTNQISDIKNDLNEEYPINAEKLINAINQLSTGMSVILSFDSNKEYSLQVTDDEYFHSFRTYIPRIKMFIFDWSHYEDGGLLFLDINGVEHKIIPFVNDSNSFYVKIQNEGFYENYNFEIELGKLVDGTYVKYWKEQFNYITDNYFIELRNLFWIENTFYFEIEQKNNNEVNSVIVKLEFVEK
jgi:hypothetical protein